MLKRLSEIVYELSSKWGVVVLEFNGESDHVHLLFEFYPQMQLSKFVNSLKTVTSRLIRKEFEDKLPVAHQSGCDPAGACIRLESAPSRRHVFWNESYFIATCGGVTVDVLKKYVENQGKSKQ